MPKKDRKAYGNPRFSLRAGKASPEQMKAFTQNLVNINPFSVPSSQITSTMVTAWLKKYGIGVDCSGFVTQTLDYSTTKINKKDPKIGDEKIRVDRGSGSLKGGQRNFTRITKPKDVRPGDTMWLPGHIRIVTRVGPGPNNKGIQMMIAESTVSKDMPASVAQGKVNRIGVDQSIWWFPQSNAFPKTDQDKLAIKRKTSGYNWEANTNDVWKIIDSYKKEEFIFGRYKPLNKGRKNED